MIKLDLKPLLSGQTDRIDIDCSVDVPAEAAPDDVRFTTPIAVKGYVRGDAKYMNLEAGIEAGYETRCSRCLRDVSGTFAAEIDKPVALKGTLANEDTDEYLIAENSELILDIPAIDALILEFPMRVLCREDCRGLCPKCGKDLNEGDCGCDTKEIDPRLAVLASLLEKSEDDDEK